MASKEFVFEFLAHYISCKNINAVSSPLSISFIGSADCVLNPKSATACKIYYGRGKRITSSITTFRDFKATFTLMQSHGDPSIRASSSFDFSESICQSSIPTVFDLEIGLDSPNGSKFGTLFCSYQILPIDEFITIREEATTSRAKTPKSSRISVRSSTSMSMRTSEAASEAPLSSRSVVSVASSIHDRYMDKNRQWLGHHVSTDTFSSRPRSARSQVPLNR